VVGSGLPGCYYAHLASGQARLLWARRDVADVLADPATPAHVASALRSVEAARRYAAALGLDTEQRYTSYVDWPDDRVLTSIVASRPGEIEAAGFRFPLIGEVPYKGFFDRELARREAESLRARGLDVCVSAVPAYSTLGWFSDPVTTPMLAHGEDRLVETVIHELVHATVFLASEPEFNEGVASFIGEEAAVQLAAWRVRQGAPLSPAEAAAVGERQRLRIEDDRRLAAALLAFRAEVDALYAAADGRSAAALAADRAALEDAARARLARLPLRTRSAAELAPRLRLNDACLALTGTYAGDLPAHREVLARERGQLTRFVARLRAAAEREEPVAAFFGPEPLVPGP